MPGSQHPVTTVIPPTPRRRPGDAGRRVPPVIYHLAGVHRRRSRVSQSGPLRIVALSMWESARRGAPYLGSAASDAGGASLRSGRRSSLVLGWLAPLGPLGVFLRDQPLDPFGQHPLPIRGGVGAGGGE